MVGRERTTRFPKTTPLCPPLERGEAPWEVSMTRVYNKKEHTKLRRRLRNDATKAERLLWWRLRGKQADGLKFRRQYGVGEYVVDFYCPTAKLGIEIDGESHFSPSAELNDAKRLAFIESIGIHVIRFTNPQVYEELDAVVEEIWRVARERVARLANDPPVSPPVKGGGFAPDLSPFAEGRGCDCRVFHDEKGGGSAPRLDNEGKRDGRAKANGSRTSSNPPVSPLGKGGGK